MSAVVAQHQTAIDPLRDHTFGAPSSWTVDRQPGSVHLASLELGQYGYEFDSATVVARGLQPAKSQVMAQQKAAEFFLVSNWPADLRASDPIAQYLRECFPRGAVGDAVPLSETALRATLEACFFASTSISTGRAIAQQMIQGLERSYEFRRRSEVVEFLQEHPHLIELLGQAPRVLAEAFADAPLVLELLSDPELEDERALLLGIQVDMDPLGALDALSTVEDEWWLAQSPATDGKLNIDVEFV